MMSIIFQGEKAFQKEETAGTKAWVEGPTDMGEQTGMSRTVYVEGNVPDDSGSLSEGQVIQSLECPNE